VNLLQAACTAGAFVVKKPTWEAIKTGVCTPSCLQPTEGCLTPPGPSPAARTPQPGTPTPAPMVRAPVPAPQPATSGPSLQVGAWDVCDSDCRGETAYRPLLCVVGGLGVPTDLGACSYDLADFQASLPFLPVKR